MSQPGWFPDPAGQPGHFRFWDGQQWSAETTTDPASAPPPGGNFAQPKGGAGRWVGIAAILLTMVLVAWLVLRATGGDIGGGGAKEDTNSSTPTISSWDETSTPTPSEPEGSGASMVNCPEGGATRGEGIRDGRLRVRGMSVESLGWGRSGFSLPWMYEISSEIKSITPTWMSVNAVGLVKKSDGFTTPQRAARAAMSCFGTSGYYRGFTGRKDIKSESYQVNGHATHWLRAEVYVNDQGDIQGDVIDIVVVDLGDPEYLGVYLNSATIGDGAVQAEVDRSRESLTVD